jgi:glycogen debranching enzyme
LTLTDKATAFATKVVEPSLETDFYIPVVGPATRPRRTLKHDDTFAVVDSHGDIGASAGGPDGIFHADTRFLSRFELLLNGMQMLLLGSNVRDDNSVLTIDQTNPDIFFNETLLLPKDKLHVVRTLFLWRGTAYQRFGIRNHDDKTLNVRLSMAFANDFADVFEVRGIRRDRRGRSAAEVNENGQVVLKYIGLDGRERFTTLSFDPAPMELTPGLASYDITLPSKQRCSLFLAVTCDRTVHKQPGLYFRDMLAASREQKRAGRSVTAIETSNDLFNQVLCRSAADLNILMTHTPQGRYPYAGIPWYSTTFGRDGLLTALQMLWCDPDMARGVLRRLAAYQARERDPLNDAEPGKILHEMRAGEMAALREVPFGLYYGSVDSTPLFVVLAGAYAERTGDDETLRELWPHVEAALDWIDKWGDRDGDGFVEYQRHTEKGLANQGWKDSHDAVFHASGELAEGPIALAEVQGYVYAAKLLAARAARRLGHVALADALDGQAAALARRFDEAFWCDEIGTYALALDGDKRQCRVRTSNAGQVLLSGIAPKHRAEAVAASLMLRPSFTGWGIRTVARDECRYNPMSYHNGSVWPHDNALIALGFARYGLRDPIKRVFKGLFDAATYLDLNRLPELFCGFRRGRGHGPTLYPVACAPQAWSAAAPFALLQASLGLWFLPSKNEVRLYNPHLPDFLDEVVLRNLRLGTASLDLAIRQHATDISLHILRNEGNIRVSITYF